MKVTYETTFSAICPVDSGPDNYALRVTSRKAIPVESILAALVKASAMKAFQEEITQAIARELGAEVWTGGFHSGVWTEVVAG